MFKRYPRFDEAHCCNDFVSIFVVTKPFFGFLFSSVHKPLVANKGASTKTFHNLDTVQALHRV